MNRQIKGKENSASTAQDIILLVAVPSPVNTEGSVRKSCQHKRIGRSNEKMDG